MLKYKIFLTIQYPHPVHKMKAYKKYNKGLVSLPLTDNFSNGIFSLPIYPMLNMKELLKFIRILKKILKLV
jgi:dTDP-4-amino-4,6-dideoxygalactose transaminase